MSIEIGRANQDFWNELCGTTLARSLAITDHSFASLDRFDQAYLDLYPYLLDYAPPALLAGKHVLEIGLGYGTFGQRIAKAGAIYCGMDIAAAPVAMMQHRLQMHKLNGVALQASALNFPFAGECFDFVVSIGCYHHTGDTQRCVDETYRVLKPGGKALVMLYNRFSYRQWLYWPKQTFLALLRERELYTSDLRSTQDQRRTYDADSHGHAAPETDFISTGQVRRMFSKYCSVRVRRENCEDVFLSRFKLFERKTMLPMLGRIAGLDLYVQAQK